MYQRGDVLPMREPEHRPWLLDVGRLVCWLAGLFFIVGALGVFDLHALTEDGAAPKGLTWYVWRSVQTAPHGALQAHPGLPSGLLPPAAFVQRRG